MPTILGGIITGQGPVTLLPLNLGITFQALGMPILAGRHLIGARHPCLIRPLLPEALIMPKGNTHPKTACPRAVALKFAALNMAEPAGLGWLKFGRAETI